MSLRVVSVLLDEMANCEDERVRERMSGYYNITYIRLTHFEQQVRPTWRLHPSELRMIVTSIMSSSLLLL